MCQPFFYITFMKIDVIIPTLMQSSIPVFEYTLKELVKCPVVNNIYIIDNTETRRFKHSFLSLLERERSIKVFDYGHEYKMYVNNAWNYGVAASKFDMSVPYYCLLNDDILVRRGVMECIADLMIDNEMINLITVRTENNVPKEIYDERQQNETGSDITYTTDIPNGRQGWIMVGRKNQWKPIPSELKIFYGDDFIYHRCRTIPGQVVMLTNTFVSHFQSSTVNSNMHKIGPIIENDAHIWQELNSIR